MDWFKFHPAKWRYGVAGIPSELRGPYMDVIAACHENGGAIPLAALGPLWGIRHGNKVKAVLAALVTAGKLEVDQSGMVSNRRAMDDIAKGRPAKTSAKPNPNPQQTPDESPQLSRGVSGGIAGGFSSNSLKSDESAPRAQREKEREKERTRILTDSGPPRGQPLDLLAGVDPNPPPTPPPEKPKMSPDEQRLTDEIWAAVDRIPQLKPRDKRSVVGRVVAVIGKPKTLALLQKIIRDDTLDPLAYLAASMKERADELPPALHGGEVRRTEREGVFREWAPNGAPGPFFRPGKWPGERKIIPAMGE